MIFLALVAMDPKLTYLLQLLVYFADALQLVNKNCSCILSVE